MDEPIRLICSLTLDDLTDAVTASARALKPAETLILKGVLIVLSHMMAYVFVIGVSFAALAAFTNVGGDGTTVGIYILFVYGVFLLMIRYRDRISRALLRVDIARKLKGSAQLAAPIEWLISEEEIVRSTVGSSEGYRWIDVDRVLETRRCFVVMSSARLVDTFPSRAFSSLDVLDRFISLAREKVLKYDVIKPIEYAAGLDETPSAAQEW